MVTAAAASQTIQVSGGTAATVVLLYGLYLLVELWAWARVFSKAGYEGWTVLVPVYNVFVVLRIAGKPWWWILLLVVPVVNVVAAVMCLHGISKRFGHSGWFTVGLVLLAPIFIPVLGFGKSEYWGSALALKSASQNALPIHTGRVGYDDWRIGGYGRAEPNYQDRQAVYDAQQGYAPKPTASAIQAGRLSSAPPRPDWHRDPTDRHELRYWNGTEWTRHVADRGVQGDDPI